MTQSLFDGQVADEFEAEKSDGPHPETRADTGAELLPAVSQKPDLAQQLAELAAPIRQTLDQKVAEIGNIASTLPALRDAYAGVIYDVATTKGMDGAKKARQAIKGTRVALEHLRKDMKAPITALGRAVDSSAEAVRLELVALENPVDAQIKAEEARKQDIKDRKEREAREKAQAIQKAIGQIAGVPAAMIDEASTATLIMVALAMRAMTLEGQEEFFAHRLDEAQEALRTSQASLAKIANDRLELEKSRADELRRQAVDRITQARLAVPDLGLEELEAELERWTAVQYHPDQLGQYYDKAVSDGALLITALENHIAARKREADDAAAAEKLQQQADERRHQQDAIARMASIPGQLIGQPCRDIHAALLTWRDVYGEPSIAEFCDDLLPQAVAAWALAISQLESLYSLAFSQDWADAASEDSARDEQARIEAAERAEEERIATEAQQAIDAQERDRLDREEQARQDFAKRGPGIGRIVLKLAEVYEVTPADAQGWLDAWKAEA